MSNPDEPKLRWLDSMPALHFLSRLRESWRRRNELATVDKCELERIAGYAWDRIERAEVAGRTVTLKVKFGDFTIITRSRSFPATVPDRAAFAVAGQGLLAALHPLPRGIRLLGLGLHNLTEVNSAAPAQLGLAI